MKLILCRIISVTTFFVFFLETSTWSSPGDLVRSVFLGSQTQKSLDLSKRVLDMDELLPSQALAVKYYRVNYLTTALSGDETLASGLIIVPLLPATTELPILSYQHGTILERRFAPSRDSMQPEAVATAIAFASMGFAVVAADYLGLGDSAGIHPYLHAATEASSTIDLLIALRTFAEREKIKLSRGVYLLGASQGGHATLAVHRALERRESPPFEVQASAPIAGPYDLSGTCVQHFLRMKSKIATFYSAYIFMSMNAAYRLYPSLDGVLSTPSLQSSFDGKHSFGDVLDKLPGSPLEYFHPRFVETIQTSILQGENHPLIEALRDNDVFDWKPRVPVRFFHARGDQTVPFENSVLAHARMKELGAEVELVEYGMDINHQTVMIPAMARASLWFRELEERRLSSPDK